MKRTSIAVAIVALALTVGSCRGEETVTLHVYNWSDYIKDELVERFEEESGIKVVIDYFDSNEAMYAKLRSGGGGYDVVFPTTYMVEVMERSGMLATLDHAKLGNIDNVDARYTALAPDSAMRYSVPYMVSATGIGYTPAAGVSVEDLSWSLFGEERLRGRTTLLNDYRETIGAALTYLGYSYNSLSEGELNEARDLIISWKGRIAKFENDQYKNGLLSGEFSLVHGYSGDILQVAQEDPRIAFGFPREGTSISIDNMVILKESSHIDAAHRFIDFLLRGDIAAENIEYVYYLAPNTAAYSLVDPSLRANPAVFFPDEVLSSAEVLLDLGEDNARYTAVWDAIKAAR